MKAILVINMPKVCSECMYSLESSDGLHYCSLVQSFMPRGTDVNNEVSVCCPLKTMPQKQNTDDEKTSLEYIYEAKTLDEFQIRGTSYLYGHIDGWNECLDEITGEVVENKHGM